VLIFSEEIPLQSRNSKAKKTDNIFYTAFIQSRGKPDNHR